MASHAENVSIWWRHHKSIPGIERTTLVDTTARATTPSQTTVEATTLGQTVTTIVPRGASGLSSGDSTCGFDRAHPPPPPSVPTFSNLVATVQHARRWNDCALNLVSNVNIASSLLVAGNTDCLFPFANPQKTMQITYSVNIDPASLPAVDRLFVRLGGVSLGCEAPYMLVYYDLQASHHIIDKRQCPVFKSSSSVCLFYCDAIRSCTGALSVTVLMRMSPWDLSDPSIAKWCTAMFGQSV